MSDAREKLLPCPFCGGEAERIDIDEGENAGGSCICCTHCQASSNVEFGFKENFVSNWNRRAAGYAKPSPAAEAGLREALHVAYVQGCDDTHRSIRADPSLALMRAEDAEFGEAASDYALSVELAALSTRPAGESAGVAEALTAKGEFRRIGWETVTDEDGATERFFTGDFDFSEPPNWPVKVAWGLPVQITLTPLPPEDAARASRPSPVDGGAQDE